MQTLSSRAVAVQRIRLLLASAVLFFIGGFILFFHILAGMLWLLVFFALFLVMAFFYMPAYCRSVTYAMEDGVLAIHKGVFYKESILIRHEKVQYVRRIQTPAARRYHTASLIFFLAGQALWLGELEEARAKELQEVFARETYVTQDASIANPPQS